MVKSNATIKVDRAENWAKAVNYTPDKFTILVFEYEGCSPRIKIGDGIHRVNDLPFLNNSEVIEDTLVLQEGELMPKKYISKIKLPNVNDPYDITLPRDAEISVSSVSTPTLNVTSGANTTTYGTGSIVAGGNTVTLPSESGTIALVSDIPEGFYYDELN